MSPRKKILLLFGGPHLAYSPTTLQLREALSENYDVTVIAQNPHDYNSSQPELDGVLYYRYFGVRSRKFYKLLFFLLALFPGEARLFRRNRLDFRDYFFRYRFIRNHLQNNSYFRIVSNDILQLFFCTLMELPSDFLSLELTQHEWLMPLIRRDLINCVLIQSQERIDYLFKGKKLKTFFVQNAPVYHPIEITGKRGGIVFAGASIDDLGFFHCLDFLMANPEEKMTLQGAFMEKSKAIVRSKYTRLLENGQLIINTTYLSNEELGIYLQTFEIGFCLYNFDNPIVQSHYFNYATAPSGKMFKYMAAGVPVIGSNIPGFRFVEDYKCGVLVGDLQPSTLAEAVRQIRADYNTYSRNTQEVARFYSFDKRIEPYLHFLAEEGKG